MKIIWNREKMKNALKNQSVSIIFTTFDNQF